MTNLTQKEIWKRYREKNKEKIAERQRERLKDPEAFAKHRARCKAAAAKKPEMYKAKAKQWWENNPDKVREYNKVSNQQRKESGKAKQWTDDNKDKVHSYQLKHYYKKRQDPAYVEKQRERGRQQYDANKYDISRSRKERRRVDWNYAYRSLYHLAKRRAIEANIPFELDKDTPLTKPEACPVLGIPIGWDMERDNHPSLDRIVPELGYTYNNCRIISWKANYLKNANTLETLEMIRIYLLNNLEPQ